jgi:ATP synthase protein I
MGVLIAALLAGTLGAASAVVGGAIGFLPSAVYAGILRLASGGPPERLLQASYAAEAVKVVMTLLLFALTFAVFREMKFWPLFLTYLGTLAAYWLALWIDQPETQEK